MPGAFRLSLCYEYVVFWPCLRQRQFFTLRMSICMAVRRLRVTKTPLEVQRLFQINWSFIKVIKCDFRKVKVYATHDFGMNVPQFSMRNDDPTEVEAYLTKFINSLLSLTTKFIYVMYESSPAFTVASSFQYFLLLPGLDRNWFLS